MCPSRGPRSSTSVYLLLQRCTNSAVRFLRGSSSRGEPSGAPHGASQKFSEEAHPPPSPHRCRVKSFQPRLICLSSLRFLSWARCTEASGRASEPEAALCHLGAEGESQTLTAITGLWRHPPLFLYTQITRCNLKNVFFTFSLCTSCIHMAGPRGTGHLRCVLCSIPALSKTACGACWVPRWRPRDGLRGGRAPVLWVSPLFPSLAPDSGWGALKGPDRDHTV